jgi:hypothetical protein
MREADVDEIRVVTRRDKEDVVACARDLGAEVALGRPRSVGESLALGAAELGADDLALIGFPDTVWEDGDVYPALLEALGSADVCLGLFAHVDPAAADVVSTTEDGRVLAIEVKPARPAGDLIWGCAVVRGAVLAAPDDEPGRTFDELAGDGRVTAVRFRGAFVDLGVRERLERALEGEPLESVASG